MKKKIIPIIFVVLVAAFVVDALLPQPLDRFFDSSIIAEGSQFQSPFVKIYNKEYSVLSFVGKGTGQNGTDLFTVTVVKRDGALNNKESMPDYTEIPTEYVTDPRYENNSNVPQHNIKRKNQSLGYVFTGVVPTDCKKVIIDGKPAKLEKMSFEINGKEAEFYLYYLIIAAEKNMDDVEIICTDTNGRTHIITENV